MSADQHPEPLNAADTAAVRRMIQSMGLAVESADVARALKRQGREVTEQQIEGVTRALAAGASHGKPSSAINPTTSEGQGSPADQLASELGFASYLELFESSTPLAHGDDKAWLVTSIAGGQWVLWSDRDFRIHGRYSTQQEAMAHASAGNG